MKKIRKWKVVGYAFDKKRFTSIKARSWLRRNGFIPVGRCKRANIKGVSALLYPIEKMRDGSYGMGIGPFKDGIAEIQYVRKFKSTD